MKFHLPLTLRRALLAVLVPLAGVTSVSQAETDTPVAYENYTELLSFNDSDVNWFDIDAPSETTTMLLFSNNASIEFNNNTESPLLLDPSTYANSRLQVQFIGNSGDISFINNTSRAVDGGAIGLFFENNSGEILFQGNSIASGNGGAIVARAGSEITFTDNSKISFVGNSTTESTGGAIYTAGSVEFAGNSQVVFTDNTAYTAGGIRAAGITIVDTTEQVLFSGNQATGSSRYSSDTDGCGGAILLRYNNIYSLFNIANNAEVVFENNSAGVSGGAIYTQTANYCVPTFQNNTTLAFRNNTAGAKGGAVYGVEMLDFLENKYLYFENNTAEGEGGAIYSAGLLSITGNSTVAFTGNSSGTDGGAIYAPSLSITNNDTVEFRANYVKQYDEEGNLAGAVLNSIAGSSSLELSTSADYGASITFYDSVQVKYSYYHDLNTYEDSEGNTVTGTGTIAFSGLYAEEDLTAVFNELGLDTSGDTFRSCLETSLTSSFTGGTIILYGGTLSVSDNAILNILGTSGTTMAGNYTAKSQTMTEISNHGTLNIARDATFDGASALLYINNAAMTVGRNFTLSGSSSLFGGTLDIAGTADLTGAADLEGWGGLLTLQYGSSVAAGGDFTVGESSCVRFIGDDNILASAGDIVFQSGSCLDYGSCLEDEFGTGATLKASSVTMTGTDLNLYSQPDGYALIVDGDLSLTDSTLWLSPGAGAGTFCGIDVTGALSVSGTTTINLSSDYADLAGEGGVNITLFTARDGFTGDVSGWTLQSWTETYDSAAGFYDTFTTLENATLTTALLSDETGETTWGVILQLTADSSGGGGDDGDIYVYTGETVSITDLTRKVHIVGGTLDAADVSADTALSSEVIVEGTDGLLIMTEDQTLNLTGSLTGDSSVGYDVQGEDGGSAGTIGIGTAGGSLSGTAVELTGESYAVNALEVRSGIATIAESAGLGHELTEITVGTASSETTSAILVNRGAVNGKTVEVLADGSVTNYGTITAADSVTLDGGAAMANMAGGELSAQSIAVNANAALSNAGTITAAESVTLDGGAAVTNTADGELSAQSIAVNANAALSNAGTITGDISLAGSMTNSGVSTGTITVLDGGSLSGGGTFGNVDVQNGGTLDVQGAAGFSSLTVGDGSKITFSVNGVTPYSSGMSASETYSHAAVDSLTFSGTPAIGVSIGSGVIASGSDAFTLTLLQADAVTSSGAVDTDALAAALELTGSADLVSDYDLSWDEASGTLTFSGTLNTTAASGLAGQDASLLADTLWSSVSSVVSFARTAAEQGKLAGVRSSRLWGAGLGHFTSMPSAGSLSGFSYNGGGYALGADMATGKEAVAGVAFGQMFGTHKSDNSMLSDKQRAFMFALYGNVRQELDQGQELNLSGYFSYGSVDHTARTHVGGSRQTPGRAKWDDDVYAFGLLADWNIKVSDTMTVAPFTGITYMYGSRGAIAETFDGGSRSFGNGSLQTWSIPVGVTLKSVWGLSNGQSLLPEVSVAYVGDIARRNPYARTWSAGQAVTGKGHNPGRNALMTRAGLGWQISKNWQTGAYYTLEVRSGQTNQSASINASYSF